MTRRLGLLLGTLLLLWGAAAYPAYALGGERAVVFSAVALLLCLAPASLTMFWAEWTFRRAPQHYLMMVLGATGVRMFVVLGAALAVNRAEAYFRDRSFWVWVLVFYLVTLAVEVVLLLAGRTSPDRP